MWIGVSVPPAPSHGEHGTDDTAPRRARQSRRARRAHCRRLPLPTRPATCRACARGRAANPLRPARGPPSHHGAWKVGRTLSKGAGTALASKVHKSTALPNGGESQTMPSWFLASAALLTRQRSTGPCHAGRPVLTTAPPTGNVPSRPCPMAQARAVIGGTPVRLGRRVSTVNPLLTR